MEFNFLLAAAFSFLPSGKLFRDIWLILLSNYIFLCDYAHFWGLDLFKKIRKIFFILFVFHPMYHFLVFCWRKVSSATSDILLLLALVNPSYLF